MNSIDKILIRISFLALIVFLSLSIMALIKPLSVILFAPYIVLTLLIAISAYVFKLSLLNKNFNFLSKLVFSCLGLLPFVIFLYVWVFGNEMESFWRYIMVSVQLSCVLGIAAKIDVFNTERKKYVALTSYLTFVLGVASSFVYLIPLTDQVFFKVCAVVLTLFSILVLILAIGQKSPQLN